MGEDGEPVELNIFRQVSGPSSLPSGHVWLNTGTKKPVRPQAGPDIMALYSAVWHNYHVPVDTSTPKRSVKNCQLRHKLSVKSQPAANAAKVAQIAQTASPLMTKIRVGSGARNMLPNIQTTSHCVDANIVEATLFLFSIRLSENCSANPKTHGSAVTIRPGSVMNVTF